MPPFPPIADRLHQRRELVRRTARPDLRRVRGNRGRIRRERPAEGGSRPLRAHDVAAAGRRRRDDLGHARARLRESRGQHLDRVRANSRRSSATTIPGAAEDPRFWASGISLVAHMRSPLVPAVHMNTRHIVTAKAWFGGGADLTPIYPDAAAAEEFHAALACACAAYDQTSYARFKTWCDEYFFLEAPGRAARRRRDLFRLSRQRRLGARLRVSSARSARPFSPSIRQSCSRGCGFHGPAEQRRHQLVRRGRYVEFNLLYDRGHEFGLKTGGNVEAILMSLPPVVAWP